MIMKNIKKLTSQLEKEAYKNVEDFDFTTLCVKELFQIMNSCDIFAKAIYDMTYDVVSSKDVVLKTFDYGFVKEDDFNVYPKIDMVVKVKNANVKCDEFRLSLSPFSAVMDAESYDDVIHGNCDKQLTNLWRIIMNRFYKEKWDVAFVKFCEEVRLNRLMGIERVARNLRNENNQRYQDDVNSIV